MIIEPTSFFSWEMGRFWLSALSLLASVAVGCYTWIATRDKDNSQHIKAVEKAMAEHMALHAARLDRLETNLAHLPTEREFGKWQGDMRAMQATQEATQRDMHVVRIQLERIENFLLSNSNRGTST